MATFEATTHPLAFAHMEGGLKTLYVVPAGSPFQGICSGDRIEFDDLGSITVGMVRRYPGLTEMLETEGYTNVVPEAESAGHAVTLLEASTDWDKRRVEERGVLALRVRSSKRKS